MCECVHTHTRAPVSTNARRAPKTFRVHQKGMSVLTDPPVTGSNPYLRGREPGPAPGAPPAPVTAPGPVPPARPRPETRAGKPISLPLLALASAHLSFIRPQDFRIFHPTPRAHNTTPDKWVSPLLAPPTRARLGLCGEREKGREGGREIGRAHV